MSSDILTVGSKDGVRRDGAHLLDQIIDVVRDWERCAVEAKVPRQRVGEVGEMQSNRRAAFRGG